MFLYLHIVNAYYKCIIYVHAAYILKGNVNYTFTQKHIILIVKLFFN